MQINMISSVLIALGFVALTTLADLLGVWVVLHKLYRPNVIRVLTHFAVGTLLAFAILDLLPEALENGVEEIIFLVLLGGIIGFYILERIVGWDHLDAVDPNIQPEKLSARGAVILVGATIEEFVDGAIIGLAVVLGQGSLGLVAVASVAVFAHEFPDSISRAVAFIKAGATPRVAMRRVLLTTLGAFFGAALAVILSSLFIFLLPYLAVIAAAAFIYIAVSHLIPDLHHAPVKRNFLMEIAAMVFGVVLIIALGFLK